jgi:hypothetical protein
LNLVALLRYSKDSVVYFILKKGYFMKLSYVVLMVVSMIGATLQANMLNKVQLSNTTNEPIEVRLIGGTKGIALKASQGIVKQLSSAMRSESSRKILPKLESGDYLVIVKTDPKEGFNNTIDFQKTVLTSSLTVDEDTNKIIIAKKDNNWTVEAVKVTRTVSHYHAK